MELKELKKSYAFNFKLNNPNQINGWKAAGDVVSELERQGINIINSSLFQAIRN